MDTCSCCGTRIPDDSGFCPNCGSSSRIAVAPVNHQNRKQSVTSLVMGILSLAFGPYLSGACLAGVASSSVENTAATILNVIALVFCVLGIVFAIIGLSISSTALSIAPSKIAKVGRIMSFFGLAIDIIIFIISIVSL